MAGIWLNTGYISVGAASTGGDLPPSDVDGVMKQQP